jgi:GTPase SAR1 family protein
MFDVSKYCSFANLKYWLNYIRVYIPVDFPKIIVGCKTDLKREISYEEAFSFAQDRNIDYIETSSKLGKNIENAFAKIIYEIKSNRKYSLRYLNSQSSNGFENENKSKQNMWSCNWFACCNGSSENNSSCAIS